jgi:antitoxin StbD
MLNHILSNFVASISDLKKHPMSTINKANGQAIAILNRNNPVFYCIPAKTYEAMIEALDDIELSQIINQRINEPEVEVDINDL